MLCKVMPICPYITGLHGKKKALEYKDSLAFIFEGKLARFVGNVTGIYIFSVEYKNSTSKQTG